MNEGRMAFKQEGFTAYRCDLRAESGPDEACSGDRELLRVRNVFRRLLHVCEVGDSDAPLECGCPAMHDQPGESNQRVCLTSRMARLHMATKRHCEVGDSDSPLECGCLAMQRAC